MPTEKAGESVLGWLVPKHSYPSRVFIVTSMYLSGGKRSLDFVVSAIGLVITAPICLVIAIAIRIDDGGAAVFTQERVGRGWHLFRIHKFRSMTDGIITAREANRFLEAVQNLAKLPAGELGQLNIALPKGTLLEAKPGIF